MIDSEEKFCVYYLPLSDQLILESLLRIIVNVPKYVYGPDATFLDICPDYNDRVYIGEF